MEPLTLRSADFRRERAAQWLELEGLVRRAERNGLRRLAAAEIERLPVLYRAAVSSLAVARAISLDRAMLEYLESLVARAYFCVYGVKPRAGAVVRDYLARGLPRAVRRLGPGVALAVAVMAAGTAVGWSIDDPETYDLVMPEGLADGRSYATPTEELRAVLYEDQPTTAGLGVFSTFLFVNNAKVGFFAFALGFALGIPTVLLLFYNGMVLGALGGLYASRGLGWDFGGWVLPHGGTELLAVALCGGAGLALALALVRPGRHGRLHALAQTGRRAGLVVLGTVPMFLVAGLIEGYLRQLVTDPTLRYLLAGASLAFWAAYFLLAGRGRRPAGRGPM